MITVVLTSPRVAPGLLTRAAWQALDRADAIGAAGTSGAPGAPAGPDVAVVPAGPLAEAVVGSGLAVTAVAGDPPAHWAWLVAEAEAGRRVAWLVAEDGEPELLRLVAAALNREPRPAYQVEVLHGSYDVPGARLIDVVRVMDRLRRDCPWDQGQTHQSLTRYLLEETYETLEALDTGDRDLLREELGDLLLQIAFHARIAEEDADEPFSVDDVAAGLVEKLVRRHPHVFGTTEATDAATVEANWETIKATEKRRTSVLDGIPPALPALALADKLLGRAAKLLPADHPAPTTPETRLGTALLTLVHDARTQGLDPEQALRTTLHHLTTEIRAAEQAG